MRLPWPKSLYGLLIVGFALVALPLLVAVVSSGLTINRLSDQSESLVVRGVAVTRRTQALAEEVTSMERNARQYHLLGAAELLDLYAQKHARFERLLSELEEEPPDTSTIGPIRSMRQKGRLIIDTLRGNAPGSAAIAEAIEQFPSLADLANGIVALSEDAIGESLDALRVSVQDAQRTLLLQVSALVPVSLLLLLIFAALIGRPLRQVEAAIGDLGDGRFSREIAVHGPEDLEKLGHRLEWLRVRLLDLALEKNRFLRHVSHELKTPLSNLREGTELLLDGAVGQISDAQREVASILRENGLRLQQLIENLLSFSAWQAKEAKLEITRFQLGELVRSILRTHKLTLIGHRLKVRLDLKDVAIEADRIKVRLALDNLVSNAIKFSPEGDSIYIRVLSLNRQAIIDVADSGPGIAKNDRQRIFDVFYQGSTPQGGHVQGTGIGLSVVRECVHAHGGTIELVDGHFSGAHFRLRLPLTQEQMNAAA